MMIMIFVDGGIWIPTLDITLYLMLGRHIDIYASRQILYNEVFN